MKPSIKTIAMKVRLGWILLAASAAILLTGAAIHSLNPLLGERFQWVMGLAILLLGMSITLLISNLPALRTTEAAARKLNAENDERNISIRNAAGFAAFLVAAGVNYAAFFVYSALTRGEGYDLLWYVLAFLAVFPVIVFILFVIRLQKRI
jgi:hypothetical protein